MCEIIKWVTEPHPARRKPVVTNSNISDNLATAHNTANEIERWYLFQPVLPN